MRGPLTVGDKVLLIDPKGRRYLVTLKIGGEFHSHGGYIPHDELIGRSEGTTVKATKGLDSTDPPTNVVCDTCQLGPNAAHTVSIQVYASISSGQLGLNGARANPPLGSEKELSQTRRPGGAISR